jgi:hypothetical protein
MFRPCRPVDNSHATEEYYKPVKALARDGDGDFLLPLPVYGERVASIARCEPGEGQF